MDEVEGPPHSSARNEAPPSVRKKASKPPQRRKLGVLDATLLIQKMWLTTALAAGKKQSPALPSLNIPSGHEAGKDLTTASARTRASGVMKKSAHARRQTEEEVAHEALRMKLEAEATHEATELAAQQAREQRAAIAMGVYARRLLARRTGAELKQRRLLKTADHIDKAIMNKQGRAKLAEMREQKVQMNEFIRNRMSC